MGKVMVTVKSGALLGVDNGDAILFNGIPYARPPVGVLRWMPPEPAAGWKGVREAIAIPPQCAQNAYLGVFSKPGGQEDCLYLNVWMPKTADPHRSKLPVMVWIHGGGLRCGAGSDYNGLKLAVLGNCIVVTINYRLGMLGIFAHPALAASGQPFGNFGLMDQQAALHWIKDNIEAFGGDPDNITIFGESSGGTSVMAHVVAPRSKGFFNHAIVMSGGALITPYPLYGCVMELEQALEKGVAFAEAAGADGSLESLRALPVEQILQVQTPHLAQQFFVDEYTLVELPVASIRAGRVNGESLTNGCTRDEATWQTGLAELMTGKVMDAGSFRKEILFLYGEDMGERVLQEFRLSDFPSPSEAFARARSQYLFSAALHWINGHMAKWMPTYAYEFADRTAPSYLEPTTFPLGAAHTFELAYLFPGYCGARGRPVKLNPLQERLSDKMVSLFSRTHEAAGARETDWPRYDPTEENYLTFALPEPRQPHEQFSKVHNVAFWESLGIW